MSSLKATWLKSASTTVATVLGQAPGFLVPVVVARMLGATAGTDAFFLALTFVSFVLNAIAGATQHALVPLMVYLDKPRARALLSLVQTLSLGTMASAGVLLAGGSRFVSVPSAVFVMTLLPFALSAALASVWTGALYAERRYVVAALTPAIRHLGVLALFWMFADTWGVYALVWGYSLAEIARLCCLGAFLRPPALSWPVHLEAPSDLVAFLKIGGAQAAGSAVIALIPVVDRLTASSLAYGSVSLLDYADRVCQAPVGLLMSGFLVVSLAQWSHDAARGDSIELLKMKTRRSSLALCSVSVVPVALILVYRQPIAALLFGTKHLHAAEIHTIGNTLGGYLLGMPVLLAGLTYARAFLVLRRSDWLLKVSIGQFAGKILLNAALTPVLGLPGIALSTTAVYALGSLAHVWKLHHLSGAAVDGR